MSFLGLFEYSWNLVGIIPTTFQESWWAVQIYLDCSNRFQVYCKAHILFCTHQCLYLRWRNLPPCGDANLYHKLCQPYLRWRNMPPCGNANLYHKLCQQARLLHVVCALVENTISIQMRCDLSLSISLSVYIEIYYTRSCCLRSQICIDALIFHLLEASHAEN